MLLPAATLLLSGAAAADAPLSVHADRASHVPHSHVHAPGEIDESHDPLLLQITYTGEVMGNAAGGVRRGARYLDNLDLVFEADMGALVGWRGARVHVYGLYNNGRSISDLVGDAQAVSNIETGVSALRLYEAWADQKLGKSASIRVGLYDLNSEFDALDAAGLFVSSPNGIGTDIAQSGRNGPSIFPSTSLAARFDIAPADGWTIRAAVLDGVPGDPNHPRRTSVRLGNGDGALLIGELQAPVGGGKLLLGHWRYTAKQDRLDGSGRARENSGVYVRGELPLVKRGKRQLDGFARLGTADGRLAMFDRFAGGGLKFSGWVPGRDADDFGLAIAAAFTSRDYRLTSVAAASEIAVEATYRARVNDWLLVQPSLHYIRNPNADPALADALVLGFRFEASHSLLGF